MGRCRPRSRSRRRPSVKTRSRPLYRIEILRPVNGIQPVFGSSISALHQSRPPGVFPGVRGHKPQRTREIYGELLPRPRCPGVLSWVSTWLAVKKVRTGGANGTAGGASFSLNALSGRRKCGARAIQASSGPGARPVRRLLLQDCLKGCCRLSLRDIRNLEPLCLIQPPQRRTP